MKHLVVASVLIVHAQFPVQAGWLGTAVGGAVGGAVGKTAGKAAGKEMSESDVTKTLEAGAAEVNKQVPRIVDEGIRLDRATSAPGRNFTYHHTITYLDSKEVDMASFERTFAGGIRARVCANQAMIPLFKMGVTTTYSYQGRDGVRIGSVQITPQQCGF